MHQQHRVACTAALFYPIFVLSHLSPNSRVNNPTYIRTSVDTVRGKAGGASTDSQFDALLYVLRKSICSPRRQEVSRSPCHPPDPSKAYRASFESGHGAVIGGIPQNDRSGSVPNEDVCASVWIVPET